ncbi:MAG: alkaline shock response membrane anchor protein AmaP [Ornithinimicrobium sp.]
MKQLAGTLNRGWLGVLGLILALTGISTLLVATGLLSGPVSGSRVIPSDASSWLALPWVVLVVAVLGVVLAVLAVAWLSAQYPRTNTLRTLRFHDDPRGGLTTCDPGALCDVVEEDLRRLPAVSTADVLLRGTAASPEVSIRVSVDDRAEISTLLEGIRTPVLSDMSSAIGAPLSHVAVRVDIERGKRETRSVTL